MKFMVNTLLFSPHILGDQRTFFKKKVPHVMVQGRRKELPDLCMHFIKNHSNGHLFGTGTTELVLVKETIMHEANVFLIKA